LPAIAKSRSPLPRANRPALPRQKHGVLAALFDEISQMSENSPEPDTAVESDGDERDVMLGVTRTTEFLRIVTEIPDLPESRVYNWIQRGYLPASYLGTTIVTSKKRILERLQKPTNMGDE
jgi:hypothetical protein